ncbi:MAG: glucan 1,4-alpha-glucosidase [Caldilineaceae bacterium]
MTDNKRYAPGWPGIPPRWTSSAKSGVGAALDPSSHVWFTLSHGILNEIYYPRLDQACTRDLGLIVTDGGDFFSEEKRHAQCTVEYLSKGVPAYRLVNQCVQGRYRIEKEVFADPNRDVVLQIIKFAPLQGKISDYHLYALLAPHLGNRGWGNTAWVGEFKGRRMLFAQADGVALAMACSEPWLQGSAGFVGASDGWQDLRHHKQLTWHYDSATNGNVALTGEIDLAGSGGNVVVALGFGLSPSEAGLRTLSSLQDDVVETKAKYIQQWQTWQSTLDSASPDDADLLFRTSAMVLRTHEQKRLPGGGIASLSIPWGSAKGDDDLGGYHLVWPRDLVEAAGGFLAAGASEDALRILCYLQSTQEEDGHWPQNMWLDGRSYWHGIQMDETAFPILLVALTLREEALTSEESMRFWPMVRSAAGYLVRNGPVTEQDRWEEDPGYSPFTLAVEISALLVAADLADKAGEDGVGAFLRETADIWNANIERWTYITGGELAQQFDVEGYYARIAPVEQAEASSPKMGFVPIKNRPPGENRASSADIVSPDALALVRFGLRAADDPRIVNTIKVIDALLKEETPAGAAWRRYQEDGYGEHKDGSPFDGTGIGRLWPLLAGERGHYELAAGRREVASSLLHALESFAGDGGLLPEQVWDAPDIPEKELYCGRPSGSAMPLVWAHAEYLKLLRSLHDGQVFDTPQQCVDRYGQGDGDQEERSNRYMTWRFNHRRHSIPRGSTLRLELLAPAVVRWSDDEWQTNHDVETRDTGLGLHVADLLTNQSAAGTKVQFTFHWTQPDHWEGTDYAVDVSRDE